ncbi:hypothetical protein RPPS3_25840 [Rhodopseudomonas palustris]|uniref:hypothetical protein n=1 Tax=Rhodopseudomonas palustris TaxID=1076 RepID=UPI000D19C892|nr:hypothetical protein [Rhodopseudomonas palustris]AVT76647.1 hypothetical protein RPPS3_25840 [Rhodopseudomonas palustris]
MADIFGPATADYAVTVRPAETRTFDMFDTWIKDCSSATAEDGTELEASFFNGIIAALRSLARANGATLADSSDKIVAEVGTDDDLLTKAVQNLIQRGLTNYVVAAGTAAAMVATLQPALKEYRAGFHCWVKASAAPTGSTTVNFNGLGAKLILNQDGSAIVAGQWSMNASLLLFYNGTYFELKSLHNSAGPMTLTAPRDYYVNASTGSDSNDGLTLGAAFQTLQKVANVASNFILNGYTITVHIAPGTYAPVTLPPLAGGGVAGGLVKFVGDVTTPANVLISASQGPAVTSGGKGYLLSGVKVASAANNATTGAHGSGITAQGSASEISLVNVEYGFCYFAHKEAAYGGTIYVLGTEALAGAFETISGGAGVGGHEYAYRAGRIFHSGSASLSISSAVAIGYFANSQTQGMIVTGFSSITGAGNMTGQKYYVSAGAVIDVGGAGGSYLPGTTAGVNSGGYYL